MQPDEAERLIAEKVIITRQRIVIMKGLILAHGTLERGLKELDATRPSEIILHPAVDPMPLLKKASDWISYSLAGCEAVWELIHSGVLIQLSSSLTPFSPSIAWTTVYGNSGGSSGGLQFEQFGHFRSAYPNEFSRSWASDRNQILADADLYLQRLSLPKIHQEIEEALRDAVRCFRAELFVPSVVMLGKASEGIWIELGVALCDLIGHSDAKAKKLGEALVGPEIGFAKKLREILAFYESHQPTFKPLAQQVGVKIEDVRTAMLWSDTLRDARNAIHHRVSTSTDASYEIVATLLLAAVPHLQTIYSLHRAAKDAKPLSSVPPITP
jgi:hypothetical protein